MAPCVLFSRCDELFQLCHCWVKNEYPMSGTFLALLWDLWPYTHLWTTQELKQNATFGFLSHRNLLLLTHLKGLVYIALPPLCSLLPKDDLCSERIQILQREIVRPTGYSQAGCTLLCSGHRQGREAWENPLWNGMKPSPKHPHHLLLTWLLARLKGRSACHLALMWNCLDNVSFGHLSM